jgi:RNA polymerase-binding transcription factor
MVEKFCFLSFPPEPVWRIIFHRSPSTQERTMAAKTTLTETQVEKLLRKLKDERSRVVRVLQASIVREPSEDLSEVEEAAQRLTERTEQLRVAERERSLLAEVDHALAKFDAGTYGISEKTGAPIPYERLDAIPWARQGTDE